MEADPYNPAFFLLQSTTSVSSGIEAWYFLVILAFLILSAIVSGAEAAFFSIDSTILKQLEKSTSKTDIRIAYLLHHPKKLLSTLLIANSVLNIGMVIMTAFITHTLEETYHWNPWVTSILEIVGITFIIVFFGEINPKIVGSHFKAGTARFVVWLVYPLFFIFYPLSWVLSQTTRFIERSVPAKKPASTAEDLRHAIDLTSDEESPEEEKDILKGLVNLGNIQVKSVMRSRVDVKFIDFNSTFAEVIAKITEYGYSRLPVFDGNSDNVKGVLHIKDFIPYLKSPEFDGWKNLIRPSYFVPESKKLKDLLEEFQAKRLHIAIVVDEYGGTSGIITLEDILEEIFGEISDEFDVEEPEFTRISDTEFIFQGNFMLNDFIRIVQLEEGGLDDVKGDNESLAGLILELNGKFPKAGDIITHENFSFIIESVTPTRIDSIRVIVQPGNHEEE